MTKLCACGCGQPAPIATRNYHKTGVIKGQPQRFIKDHHQHRGAFTIPGGKYRYTPEIQAYRDARSRCTDSGKSSWPNYGGRGIRFLFTSYKQFMEEVGPRPAGVDARGNALYSLDRKDNDGNYEPGNVRWATKEEQTNNQRQRKQNKDLCEPEERCQHLQRGRDAQ